MSLTRDEALAIQQRAMTDFVRVTGASAPGSRVEEAPGVVASVVPATPGRSITNSVFFTDRAALLARLDHLAEVYEREGVSAWTVWVPDFDTESAAELERRGHVFDGDPLAMVLELADWQAPELGDLDWDDAGSGEVAGALNDLAYGLDSDGLAPAVVAPPPQVRQFQARVDGEVACVLSTIDHHDDLGFYWVATHPQHRGKRLASRLMTAVLSEARERGMQTSSLQASKMGRSVYRRLGFESYFRLAMWERRQV